MSDTTILKDEQDKMEEIIRQLCVGGTPEYEEKIAVFMHSKLPSPVRIPMWMFRKFKHHAYMELDDIERVALAHVIHFTDPSYPYGYMECSGNIEKCCSCTVEEAHNALARLVNKNLIECRIVPDEICYGHKRNFSYIANIPFMHQILAQYGTDVWM